MSLWGDLAGLAVDAYKSSKSGDTVVSSSNSSTDVTVNPEVTVLNNIDLTPLQQVFAQGQGLIDQGQQATAAVKQSIDGLSNTVQLTAAALLLGFVVMRKVGR